MSGSYAPGGGSATISLDQLIALNQEIAALSQAGMPLERGLRDLGGDFPGRLGELTATLGQRMERGESLPQALEALGPAVPRVYKAVVEAGLRSGRLSVALEGLATYARSFAEARRSIGLALWYPLLVLVLAYALFVALLEVMIPRFVDAFESLGIHENPVLEVMSVLGRHAWAWGPILPLALLIFGIAWRASGRSSGFGGRRGFGILRVVPWIGRMMTDFESASFAGLLALLVEHQVPYPEALELCGAASADPRLEKSSRSLAEGIRKGSSPAEILGDRSAFPPLLHWVLLMGSKQGDYPATLRVMSARYRRRARRESDKIRVLLPIILLLVIGAGATLTYAATLILPLTSLWSGLAGQAQ